MKRITTRTVDELGRIVLPMELRERYQIEKGTALDVYADKSGQIILQKPQPYCKICGETNDLTEIADKNIFICGNCKDSINESDAQ